MNLDSLKRKNEQKLEKKMSDDPSSSSSSSASSASFLGSVKDLRDVMKAYSYTSVCTCLRFCCPSCCPDLLFLSLLFCFAFFFLQRDVLDLREGDLTGCEVIHSKFASKRGQDRYPWKIIILSSNFLMKLEGFSFSFSFVLFLSCFCCCSSFQIPSLPSVLCQAWSAVPC
jgi:hypothetical protein